MLTHQPTDTMHLTVTAIAVDQALQVRDGLDDATVARYRESFDRLPPIDVFDTPDGYVLADGFHRYQAAVELGHVEIAARVHRGSRDDAADYAATANAAAGKPLTAAERRRAIIGLHARHPDWTQQRIADAMSVAQSTVHYILASVAVTRATPIKFDNPTTAAVIHQAPPEQWAPLAQAAQEQGWTVQETRAQVRAVTAPPVPLANIAPPPELTDGGADVPTVAYPPVPRGTDATVKRRDVFTLKEWAELHPDMQMTLRDEGIAGSFGPVKFNKQDTDHIEWAQWSWNPVTGCKHDCSYCYARDIAVRFYPHGFAPAFLPYRLAAPRSTQVPPEAATNIAYKNVFTCSMADLFGKWVPREWIEAVLAVVRDNPQWNFLFLTKFPTRLAEFSFPDNAWLGTSVDAQARIPNAEKAFARVQGGVKWLSCEPMLERLTFSRLDLFDWVVIGGASESTQTPEFRPPRAWVTHLERQAEAAGCKVYEKTNLLERRREYPGAPALEPVVVPDAFKMGYLQRDVLPVPMAGAS